MTRLEIIEKIQKLIELASSPNAHEAKLAMAKAQELMAKYAIDHVYDEVDTTVVSYSIFTPKFLNNPAHFPTICHVIGRIFGCLCVIHTGRNAHVVMYGYQTNIIVATNAIYGICNQAQALFRKGYASNRSITFSSSFWAGFVNELQNRFMETGDNAFGMVVYDAVQSEIDKLGLKGRYTPGSDASNMEAFISGRGAGRDVQIRSGISESTKGGRFLE